MHPLSTLPVKDQLMEKIAVLSPSRYDGVSRDLNLSRTWNNYRLASLPWPLLLSSTVDGPGAAEHDS